MARTEGQRSEYVRARTGRVRESLTELGRSCESLLGYCLGGKTVQYGVVVAPYLFARPDLTAGALERLMGNEAYMAQALTDWHNWMVYDLLDPKEKMGVPLSVEIIYQQMLIDLLDKYGLMVDGNKRLEVKKVSKLFRKPVTLAVLGFNLRIPLSDELRFLVGSAPEMVALIEMGHIIQARMAALKEQITLLSEKVDKSISQPMVLDATVRERRAALDNLAYFDVYRTVRKERRDEWGNQIGYRNVTKLEGSRRKSLQAAVKLIEELIEHERELQPARSARELIEGGTHPFVIEKMTLLKEFSTLRQAYDLFIVTGPLRLLEGGLKGSEGQFEAIAERIRQEADELNYNRTRGI